MIERGIIYLFCAILAMFLLMGCTTAPPYVCQQALKDTGETAILCMPIKADQVVDTPVPAKPPKPVRPPGKDDGA